jgi:hypothetical protein
MSRRKALAIITDMWPASASKYAAFLCKDAETKLITRQPNMRQTKKASSIRRGIMLP